MAEKPLTNWEREQRHTLDVDRILRENLVKPTPAKIDPRMHKDMQEAYARQIRQFEFDRAQGDVEVYGTARLPMAELLTIPYGRRPEHPDYSKEQNRKNVDFIAQQKINARKQYPNPPGPGQMLPQLDWTTSDLHTPHTARLEHWKNFIDPIDLKRGGGLKSGLGFVSGETQSVPGSPARVAIRHPLTKRLSRSVAATLGHELGHKTFQQNQALTDLILGKSDKIPPYFKQLEESGLHKLSKSLPDWSRPWKKEGDATAPGSWWLNPPEFDLMLGDMARYYARNTRDPDTGLGKRITTTEEAGEFLDWYKKQMGKHQGTAHRLYAPDLMSPGQLEYLESRPEWNRPYDPKKDPEDMRPWKTQLLERLQKVMQNEPRKKDIWQQLIS